jgi:predicted N-acyltransferase
VLQSARFSAIPSLPVATLDIPFRSLDEYLASLPPKMRQDLRRKLRQSACVRIEYRDTLDGIEDEIVHLYTQTRANRKASYDAFDELPDGYFREVMSGLGGQARLLLLWVGDTLAGFNLFILERDCVVGRYLGLRYPLARDHNLYFVNWLTMVSFCIEHGFRTMQVGQTSYTLKAKLGCRLHRSWIYCKHTGLFGGALFRLLSPYAAFDRMDPDLRNLGGDAPYADPPQGVL